jgi:hypothetical protein
MSSKEDDFHFSLETLWKHWAENIPLSQDERDHVCGCEACLQLLGICGFCNTLEQARRLQQESSGGLASNCSKRAPTQPK